jgi:hypothetical protein
MVGTLRLESSLGYITNRWFFNARKLIFFFLWQLYNVIDIACSIISFRNTHLISIFGWFSKAWKQGYILFVCIVPQTDVNVCRSVDLLQIDICYKIRYLFAVWLMSREPLWNIRGPFAKLVDSPYYSESELCGGAVTVSFSKYLRWQAMHFLQRCTRFSKSAAKPQEDSGTGGFDLSRSFLRL